MWPTQQPREPRPPTSAVNHASSVGDLVRASIMATETVLSPRFRSGSVQLPDTSLCSPSIEDLLTKYAPRPQRPKSPPRSESPVEFLVSVTSKHFGVRPPTDAPKTFGVHQLASSSVMPFARLTTSQQRTAEYCNSIQPVLVLPKACSSSDLTGQAADRTLSRSHSQPANGDDEATPFLTLPHSCVSRRSSAGDSAIDLGATSDVPHSPQDHSAGEQSRRLTLNQAQTLSFTQITPSVVISDHSDQAASSPDLNRLGQGSNGLGCDQHLCNGMSRKHSSSSISSDYDESCRSAFSDSSSYSLDDDDSDFHVERKVNKSKSSWRKIRNMVHWSPFVQQFKKHKYPWVQLAGHQGSFQAGEQQGTILKKLCPKEHYCLQALMTDILRPYIPEYKGDVEKDGDKFIEMQDLLCEFESPCVMDCKIGTRTYLEDELGKARQNPKLRKDMYKKMTDIDPSEPTTDEHASQGVTKPRYMIWRETMSSTANLGFRIEGIKRQDKHSTNYKTTRTRESVKEVLWGFLDQQRHVVVKYLRRLKAMRATLESSPFFASHEVIGSSLLFVHDHTGEASVWMIDFGKTTPLPPGSMLNHRSVWEEGNREDGYLFGLDNFIAIFEEILNETNQPSTIST